jgi:CRISPR type III-A-associated RAMP protein Csm5
MKNKINYKMKLDAVTPIHIADVDYKSKVKKNEYVLDFRAKKLTIIDTNKFVDFLVEKGLYEKYISWIQTSIERFNLYTFLDKNHILSDIDKFKKETYNNFKYSFIKDKRMNEINLFIRNSHRKPYIPGSSIKGALMNFLLVDYIVKNRSLYKKEINDITSMKDQPHYKFGNNVSKIISSIENDILYGKGGNDKKGHGLSVSDTYNTENLKTAIYKDIDQKMEGKRQGYNPMPNYREYIAPHSKLYFDITIDYEKIKNGKLEIQSIEDLLTSLKNAGNYLVKNTLKQNRSSNLILGGNTGYHQKTVVHALFPEVKERVEIVKRIINKSNNRKDLIKYHLNDKNFSPRVINRVDNNKELAGLANITKEV